jgi:hypothetical protein
MAGTGDLEELLSSDEEPNRGTQASSKQSPGGRDILVAAGHGVLPDGHLRPLNEVADFRHSPARECSDCFHTLPVDLDDRTVITVAVVGTVGAGKSHYLAAALHDAVHSPVLERHGLRSFRPDEASAYRFRNDYYARVHGDRRALEPTRLHSNLDVMFRPLVYRTEYSTASRNPLRKAEEVRCSVLIHDLPGEMLINPSSRRQYAPFLRAADAFVLLVDPMAFPAIAGPVARRYPHVADPDLSYTQGALVNGLADELGDRAKSVPVAITLTKADLIRESLGRRFLFDKPVDDDAARHVAQIDDISNEVQDLLLDEFGDGYLNDALDTFAQAKFHAVAAIGSQPDESESIGDLRPLRCLDPLVTLLRVR